MFHAVAQRHEKQRTRLLVTVSGRVQGVGFRWAARDQARALGITGEARNRPDGSVEMLIEGLPDALREFQTWCYSGPESAEVTAVSAQPEPARGTFTDFSIT